MGAVDQAIEYHRTSTAKVGSTVEVYADAAGAPSVHNVFGFTGLRRHVSRRQKAKTTD